ncbi:MAG: hypothetical protein P8M68_04340 [Aquiluna sp.]|nr:hypothetical protein [Aquiluna sp.]MDG2497396.1 hypothetical protein [Aquiluna sp.]
MNKKWILLGYTALFLMVVSSFDLYAENTYLVAGAAALLCLAGLAAWLWSAQKKRD